jgi:hypothetical protein
MMNRTALGLAVGAGYLLGRTRKLKLAVAVGSLVAGRKLNLSPRAVADLATRQLKNNPQVAQIGDQLRQDLGGAGKAATGALVERRITALADRLHERTARVREQASGTVDEDRGEEHGTAHEDEYEDREGREAEEESTAGEQPEPQKARRPERTAPTAPKARRGPAQQAAEKTPSGRRTEKSAKQAASQAARRTSARRTTSAKAAAPGAGTAVKKTTGAGGAAARARLSKGGGER